MNFSSIFRLTRIEETGSRKGYLHHGDLNECDTSAVERNREIDRYEGKIESMRGRSIDERKIDRRGEGSGTIERRVRTLLIPGSITFASKYPPVKQNLFHVDIIPIFKTKEVKFISVYCLA